MRTPLVFAFVLSCVAFTVALLTPDSAGACSPCYQLESGEKWHLEVESWTVDGEPAAFTAPDAGIYLSNPIPREGWQDTNPSVPDRYLDAALVDPGSADGMRLRRLIGVLP